MKYLLALLLALVVSQTNAQQVQTTPNLITSGTNHTWSGVTTGSVTPSGGPAPVYDPSTNTINFSYNANAYVGQVMMVNQALANAGAGIKINGYNYSYEVRNMNNDNRQSGTDTFTVATVLRGLNNSTLLYNNQYFNTKFEWTSYSGTKTATTPYDLSAVTYLQIGITGGDNGYWAGYYGPQVRNVNMSLNYTVDPCAANPAYSPSCANYNTVATSNNLVPDPTAYAQYGGAINQSYAINQALGQAGANVMIHGFQWGYVANALGPYCAAYSGDICSDYKTPSITTNVGITSSTGSNIYSITRNYQNSFNTTNYSYIFPSSRNLSTLGNFNFTATTNEDAYIGSIWSRSLYTPDPCTVNPLSSTSCPGYAQAYHDQQCSINPLYATTCTGYAQAYFNQQCTANPLYNASCPGYATAYHNQQCSLNPLYANDCPGYAAAYKAQQCSLNGLYATDCPNYATAYKAQQCSLNGLYATDCPNYATAYKAQQCSLNALYATDCPGYTEAYNKKMATDKALAQNTETATAASTPVATTTTSTSTATTGISDPVVSEVVSTPSTTSATSVTSVTSVVAPSTNTATSTTSATSATVTAASTPAAPTPAQSTEKAADEKKTGSAVASVEKKAGGNKQEAAKAAQSAAKETMEKASKAATMEDQAATQGLVVGLMGYVPGFSAYQNSLVPDVNAAAMAKLYNKPNVDNRNAQRRLSGANEIRWQEMVDSQYKK